MGLWDWVWESIPEGLRTAFVSFLGVTLWSWIGRMMWHVAEVQKQRRAFWSWNLLWETIMAVLIGFIADGVVSYLGLSGKPATAVIVGIAYLGPRGSQALVQSMLERLPGLPPSR